MNQTFLTPAALDALGTLAASGFQTPVTIYRRAVGTGSTDYGDDYVTYNQVGRPWPQDTWTSTQVNGWLSKTLAAVQEPNSGQIVTVTNYELRVPRGTNIRVGDQLTAQDETDAQTVYIVSDTNADLTFVVYIVATLRKLE